MFWISCQFCSWLSATATWAYDFEADFVAVLTAVLVAVLVAILAAVLIAVFNCFSAFLTAAIIVVAAVDWLADSAIAS